MKQKNSMNRVFIIILLLAAPFSGCVSSGKGFTPSETEKDMFSVSPKLETEPVYSDPDDTATWINRNSPEKSLILATDKGYGLLVFNMDGKLVKSFKDGHLNNVDIREGFKLGNREVAIAAASKRDDNSIAFYVIDQGKVMKPLTTSIPGGENIRLSDEVYGICLYHSIRNGDFYVIANFKSGKIFQWRIRGNIDGSISHELARTINTKTQPEGCVADDELGWLYLGEEDHALWKFHAEPSSTKPGIIIDRVGSKRIPRDDIEGVTLYKKDKGKGYLILSSQGNSTYVVYEREGKNNYLGRFSIDTGNGIDKASETDGIEAVNFNFGKKFPKGLFIVQDDKNEGFTKNFKAVSWADIEEGLNSLKK